MEVVPAVAVELLAAREVLCDLVPAPEPWEVVLVARRFLALVLAPSNAWSHPEDTRGSCSGRQGTRDNERADVNAHAVVDVGLPADGLLVQPLPANEDVVGRLAIEDLLELAFQVLGGGDASVGSLYARLLVCALTVKPIAELGARHFVQDSAAFRVGCGEVVIAHKRGEAVSATVPDLPDKRALIEQFAVLLKEAIAKPIIQRLATISDGGEQLI